jgi:hypothetical protein
MPEILKPILHHLISGMIAVERGAMEPRVGTALAAMAGAVVRIYEASQLEGEQRELAERVAALESADTPHWRGAR